MEIMEKIEAGNRVRLARRTGSIKDPLPVGALGTVVAVENGIIVSWDGWADGWSKAGFPEDSVWGVDRDLLEMVDSKGSPWKPREGDKVIITKSSTNWAQDMDKYNGQTVVVTEVSRAENVKTTIRFDGDGSWQWALEDGHFKKATNYTLLDTLGSTTSNEDDLFILPKSGDKYWRYDYGHFMGEKEYYNRYQGYAHVNTPSEEAGGWVVKGSDDLFSGRAKSNITEEEISALSEVVKFNF